MKRIKENLSRQGILFSNHYVGDRLAEDDEVYLFNELINRLDISAIMNSYTSEGGSMFNPRDKLAVVLYAFYQGMTSSVKMAESIRNNLRFIYLSGGHIIKRRTICDFRIKHKESIRKIFESSIKLAIEIGLIDKAAIFALDGSKIEANASFSKTRRKGEWKERQRKIVEHVDNFLREWEETDEREEGFEEERKKEFERIKSKLDKIKRNKEKKGSSIDIEEQKDDEKSSQKKREEESNLEIRKESKAVERKNKITIKEAGDADSYLKEHEKIESLLDEYKSCGDEMLLSLTEPDCRVMQSDSITKECYNVQAIANNQVIAAADVTQDENDQNQLETMIEQLKNNIDMNKGKIILASDAGYNRGKNLAYIDKEDGVDAYISMYDRSGKNELEKNRFHKENFIFDEDSDYWVCPADERLEFMKEFIRDNKKYTLYGCEMRKCIFCSYNSECISTKDDRRRGYRTIEDDGYVIYRKEMRMKMKQEDSKKIYAKRAGSIEPVFGQIKNNRRFTRFRLKGLTRVKAEFLFMAVAHNLGKILKYMNTPQGRVQFHGV